MIGQIDVHLETVLELRIEVHLADRRRLVTRVTQEFRERDFAFGEDRGELRDADCPRVTPGQKRLPRGSADRRIAERPVKPHSRSRERIDVRRPHDFVAIRPAHIRRMIVGTDPQDVGAVDFTGEGNACGGCRQHESKDGQYPRGPPLIAAVPARGPGKYALHQSELRSHFTIFSTRSLWLSTTNSVPFASTKTPCGWFSSTLSGGPPRPALPTLPVPAMRTIRPSFGRNLRMT